MSRFKKLVAQLACIALVVTMVVPATIEVGHAYFSADSLEAGFSEHVNALASDGIVDGSRGYFNGKLNISRGEFAKIAAELAVQAGVISSVSAPTSADFTDVPLSNVFAKWIYAGLNAGLWQGLPSGSFNVNGNVSRGEAAKMLVNALGLSVASSGPASGTFSKWENKLYELGAMSNVSKSGSFATRYELAKIANVARGGASSVVAGSGAGAGAADAGAGAADAGAVADVPVAGGELSVALAPDSPASSLIPQSATGFPIGKIAFTAGSSKVKLNALNLVEDGFVNPANIGGVYVTCDKGGKDIRVSRSFTVSSFREVRVAFTVPEEVAASTTEVCTIRVNLGAAATLNATLGFSIIGAAGVDSTASGVTVAGGKVSTALHSVSTASNLAAVTIENGSAKDTNIKAGGLYARSYIVQNTGANDDATLQQITFRYIGSHVENEITEVKMAMDGEVVETLPSLDNQYVTFNLQNKKLSPGGTVTLDMSAKIGAGTGTQTTAQFEIEVLSDLVAISENYKSLGLLASITNNSTAVAVTIDPTLLSISSQAVPVTKVPVNQTQQEMAIFILEQNGPDAYTENLQLALLSSGATAATCAGVMATTQVHNWRIYREKDDGSLVAVTGAVDQAAAADTAAAADLCMITFTERIDFFRGKNVFHAVADIQAAATALTVMSLQFSTAADRFVAKINSNQRQIALADIAPSNTTLNSTSPVTWVSPSITIALAPMVAAKNVVSGSANVLALKIRIEASDAAPIRVNSMQFALETGVGSSIAGEEILAVYLSKDGKKIGDTAALTTAAAPTATITGFNVDIPAGTSAVVDMFANLSTAADQGDVMAFSLTSANVNATELLKGTVLAAGAKTGTVNNAGGTITRTVVTTPRLTIQAASNMSPDKLLAAGSSGNVVGSWDIRSQDGSVNVKKVAFTAVKNGLSAAETAELIEKAYLVIGETRYGPKSPSTTQPYFEFIVSDTVPEDGAMRCSLEIALNDTNNSLATPGGDVSFALAGVDAEGTNGKVFAVYSTVDTTDAFDADIAATTINMAAGITATGTALTVAVVGAYAIGDIVLVGAELMGVTGVAGSVLTVVRGFNRTTAVAHANGVAVTHANTGIAITVVASNAELADATLTLVGLGASLTEGDILDGRVGADDFTFVVRNVASATSITAIQINDTALIANEAKAVNLIARVYTREMTNIMRSVPALVEISPNITVPLTRTASAGANDAVFGWTMCVKTDGASKDVRTNSVRINRTILDMGGPARVGNNSVVIRKSGDNVLTTTNVAHYGISVATADGTSQLSIDWSGVTNMSHREIDEGKCGSWEVLATTQTSAQDQSLSIGFSDWGARATTAALTGSTTLANLYAGDISSLRVSYVANGTAVANFAADQGTGTDTNVLWLDQKGAYANGLTVGSLYASAGGSAQTLAGTIALNSVVVANGVAIQTGTLGTAATVDAGDSIVLTYASPLSASFFTSRVGMTSTLVPGRGSLTTPTCATALAGITEQNCPGVIVGGDADGTGAGTWVTADTVQLAGIIELAGLDVDADFGPGNVTYALNAAGTVLTAIVAAGTTQVCTDGAPAAVVLPAAADAIILKEGAFIGSATGTGAIVATEPVAVTATGTF